MFFHSVQTLNNFYEIPLQNKTEHVQTSKPRAEIISQQDCYSMAMEWNFIFYNLGIYGYWIDESQFNRYPPIPSSKKGWINSQFFELKSTSVKKTTYIL